MAAINGCLLFCAITVHPVKRASEGICRKKEEHIGRHSFIRQSKLSDVRGRIDYISNPKRQEYLYATYHTEGATPEFWKNLARENQQDFKASGTKGSCIEGREHISF